MPASSPLPTPAAFEPLPRSLAATVVPPLKTQGIKTRLVPFILGSIRFAGTGRWIEPFLGSGVVLFNVVPERAIAADSNPHVIGLYQAIQRGKVDAESVRAHLRREGALLSDRGESHYYEVRRRFNEGADPHDFLFLNRSCFNGVMRFNRSGGFNVPFCRKPERFRPALVTKIANQVAAVSRAMQGRRWDFVHADWRDTLGEAGADDFVYLDPPYIGRHAAYWATWTDADALALARAARELSSGYALSMWSRNRFRENEHLREEWADCVVLTTEHFYHVGAAETQRHAMEEALAIRPGFASSAAAGAST